jgi:hypothetical protein
MQSERYGCCSKPSPRLSVVADLLPTTIVQEVGGELLVLDQQLGEVLTFSASLVAHHHSPTPHLAVAPESHELLRDLQARGLVARVQNLDDTVVTRRTAVSAGVAVASGTVLAMSMPGVTVASSVVRRPGFWSINEIGIVGGTGLVDRTQQIRLYLSVEKSVFPEITDSSFLTDWFATIDGQPGLADFDDDDYWVFWPTLPPGSTLHTLVSDFEDSGGGAPEIQGTVSNGTTTFPTLFSFNQDIPPLLG